MENAIVIDGLKKEYGKRAAVKAISLNVEQGTLFKKEDFYGLRKIYIYTGNEDLQGIYN